MMKLLSFAAVVTVAAAVDYNANVNEKASLWDLEYTNG